MGNQYKEKGGGAATGLANDFIGQLQALLSGGGMGGGGAAGGGTAGSRFNGANPVESTGGIMGILQNLLSPGAGAMGGNMQEMISKDTERQAGAIRSRFGVGGGTSFGTPAAYAEGMMRSESGAKNINAIGGLQMQALSQLLPIFANLSQKGITQREGMVTPSPWASAFASAAPLIGAGVGALAGNPGVGMQIGSMAGSMVNQGAGAGSRSVTQQAPFIMSNPGLFGGANLGMQPSSTPAFDAYNFNPSMFHGANLGIR